MKPGQKYLSCHNIEGSVFLFADHINFCSIHSRGNLGYVTIAEYEGGPFPVEKILEFRDKVRQENNNGSGYPNCERCSFLKEKVWPEKKYMFDTVALANMLRCNSKCTYCSYVQSRPDVWHKYDILPTLREMMDLELINPNGIISWSGGEPTLMRNFDDIVAAIVDYGIRCEVNSNGIIFKQSLYDQIKNGKFSVRVSMDSGRADMFHRVKGVNRFHAVKQNVIRYMEADPNKVILKYIIVPENKTEEHTREFLDLIEELDARHVQLSCDVHFQPEELDEIIDLCALMARTLIDQGRRISFAFIPTNIWSEANFTDRVMRRTHEMAASKTPAAPAIASGAGRQTLRIISHLDPVGGETAARCLGSMDKVALLSHMHPRGKGMAPVYNPFFQATEWHRLMSRQEAVTLDGTCDFATIIKILEERFRKRDQSLLIDEWALLDHLPSDGGTPAERSSLVESLQADFDILKVSVVRHPLASWIGLKAAGRDVALEDFLRACTSFARQEKNTPTVRYEDFAKQPDNVLRAVCGVLKLPFDPGYRERWAQHPGIVKVEAENSDLSYRPTAVPRTVAEAAQAIPAYRELCAAWGYDMPTVAAKT